MAEHTIAVRNDTFRAELHLDRLVDWTVPNIRKLFNLIAVAEWENRGCIGALDAYLPVAVAESEETWRKAGIAYTDGYRLVGRYRAMQKSEREKSSNNNRLMRAVKSTKATHEKWIRIQRLWAEAKAKYKIN